MDILDGAEHLLPELELDGAVKLGESRIEIVLQSVGIGEVDRVCLVRVLGDISEVKTRVSQRRRNLTWRWCFRQIQQACCAICWYIDSSLALLFSVSNDALSV